MPELKEELVQDQTPAFPIHTEAQEGTPYGARGGSEPSSFLRIVIDLPPEAAAEFKQFVHQTGESLPDLFRKALGLYKLSKEAVQQGKVVGIAEREESLETEFVGL